MRRIYLASSWRNPYQPRICVLLQKAGHLVYDFRNPEPGSHGFSWSSIDPAWQAWTPEQYRAALAHPLAVHGFALDFGAMQWCDTCVELLPAGPSAAIEAGWCKGLGRDLIVHVPALREPDLMFAMARAITLTDEELLAALLPAIRGGRGDL